MGKKFARYSKLTTMLSETLKHTLNCIFHSMDSKIFALASTHDGLHLLNCPLLWTLYNSLTPPFTVRQKQIERRGQDRGKDRKRKKERLSEMVRF